MTAAADRPEHRRNEELRARFRHIYLDEVAFNGLVGMEITRWDPAGVRCEIPFRHDLTSHAEVFHGGVVATLIDAAAGAAVLAGHDFSHGSRLATVSMTVHYLAAAPREGLVADAQVRRRGRNLSSVNVEVLSSASSKLVAEGMVVCNVTDRPRRDAEQERAEPGGAGPGRAGPGEPV